MPKQKPTTPAPNGIPNELWQRRKLLPRANGTRKESHVPVLCPQCGEERLLKLHDARNALAEQRPCNYCKASNAGKLGARAVIRKYGKDGFMQIMQKAQLKNLPSSEKAVADMLDEALPNGFEYVQQEIWYENYIIDFAIYNGERVVLLLEINGYWHRRRASARDQALSLTSLIPVVFINAELTETTEGLTQILETISPYINKEMNDYAKNKG